MKDEISFTVTVTAGAGCEDEQEVVAEFTVTSYGEPEQGPSYASGGEPATGPEWDVTKITLDGDDVPYSNDPQSLWQVLVAKADDYIDEHYDFEPPEADPDMYRD